MSRCPSCDLEDLIPFADLGDVPARSGVHYATREEALASPTGPMGLVHCPACAYVQNFGYDAVLAGYDSTVDLNRRSSPSYEQFCGDLVQSLNDRYDLSGKRVLEIGCGQGEFISRLCVEAGSTGTGYDAAYHGETGTVGAVTFHNGPAPRGLGLDAYDLVISRHWLDRVPDPFEFLVDLREQAHGREVFGYVEVPDAAFDFGSAGWGVVYPRVSHFDAYSLASIFGRAGWTIESTGALFSGLYRYIEVSANRPRAGGHVAHTAELPSLRVKDKQLARLADFAERHHAERERWQATITQLAADGQRPVLWGASARGAQFAALADPQVNLSAVVDLNTRKWDRYLPVSGHQVTAPESLAELQPKTVIITNPAYREEIAKALGDLGVTAEIQTA